MRWGAVLVAAVLLSVGSGATAQAPERSDVDVTLGAVRTWFGPGTPIALEVTVRNRTAAVLAGLRVTVALYERVRSRSALTQVFDGRLPRTPLQAFTYRLEDLPPKGTRRLQVTQDAAALDAFQGAPAGVYPLSVSLRQSTGPAIRSVATAAAYVTETPEAPLGLVGIVTIVPRPLMRPDGTPSNDSIDRIGTLRRRVGELPPEVRPLGLAVSPLLVDELATLRDVPAAQALLDSLRDLAARAELVNVPFAHAELPHLIELDGARSVSAEIASGDATLRQHLGAELVSVVVPPRLALDTRSLDELADMGIGSAIAPGSVFAGASRGLTSAEPSSSRGVRLVPADGRLDAAAADLRTDLDVSHFVADLAMAFFESPGRRRTLAVLIPATSPKAGALVAALREVPWLRLDGPRSIAEIPLRRANAVSLDRPRRVSPSFRRSLGQARRAVSELKTFTLEANPSVRRLEASLRTAVGTGWWDGDWSDGVAWANGIVASVRRLRSLVTTEASGPVTFTSRRGEVPITIVNRAPWPVRVRVRVTSPKLEFPRGSTKVIDPLQPPGTTLTFPALAEATGTFPLKVTLTSPDGGVFVDSEELVVRSTAANLLALALTIGAALFLVTWYGRRFVKRRAAPAAT